jgi:hypothetical protein
MSTAVNRAYRSEPTTYEYDSDYDNSDLPESSDLESADESEGQQSSQDLERMQRKGSTPESGLTDADRLGDLDHVLTDSSDSGSGQEFQQEISDAKGDFQTTVNEMTQLGQDERDKLIKEFNQKADHLAHPKDVEPARAQLEKLKTDMKDKADKTLKTFLENLKQEKLSSLDKAIQAMDLVVSRTDNNNISGWWGADKADNLATQLKVYFQGLKNSIETGGRPPDNSGLVTQINQINKDEANDVAQYITGALYEVAGKDQTAWETIVRTSFSDSLLTALATKAVEKPEEMNGEVKPGELKYWSAAEVSSKLMDLKGRTDLQDLSPDHSQSGASLDG